jgi:hypothetical protein
MPKTYRPIATTTLTSAAANITFSSISQAYTDLRLVVTVRQDNNASNDSLRLRFNSDGGTNYSRVNLTGDGSSTASTKTRNDDEINIVSYIPGTSAASGLYAVTVVDILNYSNTTTFKTSIIRTSNAAVGTAATVGLWRSTAAINTIFMRVSGFDMTSGTTATLYGIKAA